MDTRTAALLWCDRHCCLCKKSCGDNIELHHIVPEKDGGRSDLENLMPLCFDCHKDVGSYNNEHPRGKKFKEKELKIRREQVYEEFTRQLVPPVFYQITNLKADGTKREFPNVGFTLKHYGNSLPVRVRTVLSATLDDVALPSLDGHYIGEKLWRLNPRFVHFGHFFVPKKAVGVSGRVEIEVEVTMIDAYERPHALLPVGYVYDREDDSWYLEP